MTDPTTPGRTVPGRQTAAYEGDLVVFLIGMRVNCVRDLRRWVPVSRAMGPMLRELMTDPTSGLLGFRTLLGWREVTMVQYWRDTASLQAFAADRDRTHRPAWTAYFRSAFQGGSVGIWHETYVVPAGAHESVYVNMPRAGLGTLADVAPVGRRGDRFAERLAGGVS